jgi:hypothetical protein
LHPFLLFDNYDLILIFSDDSTIMAATICMGGMLVIRALAH